MNSSRETLLWDEEEQQKPLSVPLGKKVRLIHWVNPDQLQGKGDAPHMPIDNI